MPTNVSHTGCATECAGDTTSARSYRTSYAERERLHLRQEFYLGRRAFKLNSTVTTRKPHKWMTYKSEKVVDRARMRRDPTHFIPRTDRRPWAQRCYWETLKSIRGYDAQQPRTVLAHAWYCWGHWLDVTHIPNKHKRRYAAALVLAWRVLRRWRHWTLLAQLLAPTWQQVRLNARLLPPLFTPSGSTPPRTSPTAPRSQEVYRNPWDRKIPLAIWRYGASPWRLTLQEHEEQDPVTSENDCWSSEQDSLLWDFDRLHPGRVWLRSWHTVDCPISHSHCPTVSGTIFGRRCTPAICKCGIATPDLRSSFATSSVTMDNPSAGTGLRPHRPSDRCTAFSHMVQRQDGKNRCCLLL